MKRRDFVHLGGLTLGVGTLTSTRLSAEYTEKSLKDSDQTHTMTTDFALAELDIAALQDLMRSGKITARSLCEQYLKRIDDCNTQGPQLRAVIHVNAQALADADHLDVERRSGKVRGALHGIPILLKDNIDTQLMPTTAGSLALASHHPTSDSSVARQLREAGAVILGKTNLSEWANIRSTHSISGWSSVGGQTRNPYVLDRDPSGSSSGSAVAVAANLCAVAVGTETDGSIISPSAHCGIVGLKPTVGLVSRTGIIPISITQDTAGPMARSVRDCSLLLNAMTAADTKDSMTMSALRLRQIPQDYSTSLSTDALRGKRIGIEKSFYNTHPIVRQAFEHSLTVLRELGAELVSVEVLKMMGAAEGAEWTVLLHELKDGLNRYLAQSNSDMKSLQQIIEYNAQHKETMMPYFQQEIFEESQACGTLADAKYTDALEQCKKFRSSVQDLMQEQHLDALCGMSSGPAACIDVVNGEYSTGPYFTSPASVCGYPSISVPCGFARELPLGLCFMAREWSEQSLLNMAYAFEQATKARREPKFLPTAK